ncbi:MAG: polysaccharide deacetylase family protein [Oscillospiraceae bacterium]
MYFGSVKFFKHLIYTVIIGWFAAATFLAVFFGIRFGLEAKKNKELAAAAEAVTDVSAEDEDLTLEQYYLRMAADGYTTEDILNFIKDNDSTAFDGFAEKYIAGNPDKFDVNADSADSGSGSTAAEYTLLYPDLYAEAPAEFTEKEKTIYLTFDDGPSENTVDILNILDKYDIKATFFMCGGESERTKELMKMVADKGHTIGIHSISHDYDKVYASVESFLEDMNDTYNSIYEATGVKPQIMRFPGGSINNYNRLVYPQIIAEVTRRGFVYYDWNVSGEDATTHATWTSIYNNVLNGINENTSGRAIVLLHDSADKQLTVTTVEDIIKALLADGYSFEALDNTVKPITFSYVD